jgi:hypothetical protein
VDNGYAIELIEELRGIRLELKRTADVNERIAQRQEDALAITPEEAIKNGIDAMKKANPVFANAFDAMEKLGLGPDTKLLDKGES